MNKKPFVSIITHTLNEEKHINDCMISIKNQSYKNIEIIIVDNYSNDNTTQIASKYTKQILYKGPERSVQKNFGAKYANGKYIMFLDADARLTKNVIKECVELCEIGNDMIIIPEKQIGEGYWARVKALERKCYLNDDDIEAPWFYNRSSFFKVNGYDESMYAGEDWDLFERMKKRGCQYSRCTSHINHHIGKLKYWDMIKKKYYYGLNIGVFMNKNKSFIKRIPIFRKAYYRNYKLLLSNPFFSLGLIFMKLGESAFVLFGLTNHFLNSKKYD